MNIPSVPTDNLYKFLALTGILIFFGSFVIVWNQAERSQELLREYQYRAELIVAKYKFESLKAELQLENRARFEALLGSSKVLEEDNARLNQIERELMRIIESKRLFVGFMVVAMLIGGGIGAFGFWRWYSKVQKYQDALLAKQAKEAMG